MIFSLCELETTKEYNSSPNTFLSLIVWAIKSWSWFIFEIVSSALIMASMFDQFSSAHNFDKIKLWNSNGHLIIKHLVLINIFINYVSSPKTFDPSSTRLFSPKLQSSSPIGCSLLTAKTTFDKLKQISFRNIGRN